MADETPPKVVHMFTGCPLPGEPDADVIRSLEAALERAKLGELSSVAITGLLPNGGIYRNWTIVLNQRLALIGAVEVNRALMAQRYIDVSYETDVDRLQPGEAPPDLPA